LFFVLRISEHSAGDVYQGVKPAERKCPACKNHLVVRDSNRIGNKFLGCSQYSTCTHIEPSNVSCDENPAPFPFCKNALKK